MQNGRTILWLLIIAITLAFVALPHFSYANKSCYIIYNFTTPAYVNLTFNGTKFMERVNFVGPDSVGVTIDENASYTLYFNQSQVVWRDPNYTYTTELANISWIPREHTATIFFCSTPNAPPSTTSSTTTILTSSTTTTHTSTSTVPTTSSTIEPTSQQTSTEGGKQGPPGGSSSGYMLAGGVAIIVVLACLFTVLSIRKKGHHS